MTPNVVVLVLDDCGKQVWGPGRTASYVGLTPRLDGLLASGIYFSNAWGQPNCSPSRANALTGRLGARTGIQSSISLPGIGTTYAQSGAQWQLQPGETTIAHGVKKIGYKTACIGKWHLNGPANATDWDHPRTIGGFDEYRGYPGNFVGTNTGVGSTPDGMSSLYNAALPSVAQKGWGRIVNNFLTPSGTPVPGDLTHSGGTLYTGSYAVTVNVNDAIAFANANTSSPLFIWLAPQAPHTPLQWPPYALHSQTMNYPAGFSLSGPILEGEFYSRVAATHSLSSKTFLKASLQALDVEVGRLIDHLGPSTWWIIMGDNGTDGGAEVGTDGSLIESPYDATHGKNTMYEGGVCVPLAISGPGIVSPGRTVQCPVHLVDVYETARQIAGLPYDTTKVHDSRTLTKFFLHPDCTKLYGITPNLRGELVSSWIEPVVNPALYPSTVFTRREYASKAGVFKMIWRIVGTPGVEFYRLDTDFDEQVNLTPSGSGSGLTGTARDHFVLCANVIRGYIAQQEGLPPPNIP